MRLNKKDDFVFLVLSDIHLGHDKNKTEDIVHNLKRFFKVYKTDIIKCDIIFISGDVFDRLLSSNSPDLHIAYNWLTELVKFCAEFDIKLRILEGTPSHDWNQVRLLYKVIQDLGIKVDFKYFDKLDIENIDGMNVLYLPDEWKPKIDDIYKDTVKTIKEHNLKKVDLIIMHGAFSYQLPDFLEHVHDPEKYIELSNGPIICGHVHNRSQYKSIIIPGSFDSLNHSDDDEDKGGLLMTYNLNKHKWAYKYLDNKSALKFKTIDIRNKTIGEVEKMINTFHKRSSGNRMFLRLYTGINDALNGNLIELKKIFPNLNISLKTEKHEKPTIKKSTVRLESTDLNKSTIKDYIRNKHRDEDVTIYLDELELIDKII